jgi:hypothetical protein
MAFIISNWQTILLIVIIIGVALYLVITKQWDKLRQYAWRLILEAERTIKGNKKGAERFEQVLLRLYNLFIPAWMQVFVTEDILREKLQQWFDDVKDFLDNGKIDNSLVDKPPDDQQQPNS